MLRVLFNWGPINIYSYGLMLAVAFISGIWLIEKRAGKLGMPSAKVIDLVFYIMISGILGSRLLFVILEWEYYRVRPWDILKIWEGGLVFYGGLILAFGVVIWFLRKNKLKVWLFADAMAPALALGIAIGRIGCFLNGCCYGKISREWGVCFPARGNPPAFAQQVADGLIPAGAEYSLPVIPAQLYSCLAGLLIFLVILVLEKKKRFDGFIFWVFILLYSASRFVIEIFRYYEPNFVFAGMTISQIISIALVIISSGFLFFNNPQKNAVRFIRKRN